MVKMPPRAVASDFIAICFLLHFLSAEQDVIGLRTSQLSRKDKNPPFLRTRHCVLSAICLLVSKTGLLATHGALQVPPKFTAPVDLMAVTQKAAYKITGKWGRALLMMVDSAMASMAVLLVETEL